MQNISSQISWRLGGSQMILPLSLCSSWITILISLTNMVFVLKFQVHRYWSGIFRIDLSVLTFEFWQWSMNKIVGCRIGCYIDKFILQFCMVNTKLSPASVSKRTRKNASCLRYRKGRSWSFFFLCISSLVRFFSPASFNVCLSSKDRHTYLCLVYVLSMFVYGIYIPRCSIDNKICLV